ncbi:RICIN domain-containing protein [Streptosporangium sp. NPDC020145]|uniref:RICIN domain-containing protein n=1 Tax=Streptosporangium sp. NPDC020145 TaxID=3154694 RepID=UPI003441853C
MSIIKAGQSYLIGNGYSPYYLNVTGARTESRVSLDQEAIKIHGAECDAQTWHVFPLDNEFHLFANKNSGLVMKIYDDSTAPGEGVYQFELDSPDRAPSQTWLVEHVSDNTYRVRNQNSQLFLSIRNSSVIKGANAEQSSDDDPASARSRQWEFNVRDKFERVLNLPTFEGVTIGDIHRLTSFEHPDRGTTDPVEVANFAYPFPVITDQAYDRRSQAQRNPYYILRRYGYWNRVFQYEHGGASELTEKQTTHVGLTSLNSTQVEETTSTSVSAEASFGFKGFASSISKTFAKQMKVTVTNQEITETWAEREISRTYAQGIRVSEAVWYRADDYVLERLDGTMLIEWTVSDETKSISDAWPPQAAKELEQYRSRLT